MATSDTKQAEKEYLGRTGSSSWERVKPFSQAGADTLVESAQLLHDFAVAMLTLRPSADDLILDLGAGGCWCSDLLGRLNRRAVAVDISVDMLHAGRSRPTGADIRAVAGDLESLPFRSNAFQKAVCLNAIHHVPDLPVALREVARVLTEDGVALFSEPGRGHANAAVSTAAMRDFGVLEQDIEIISFTRACRDAGFRDVRLKVFSYAFPDFDLTADEWSAWSRLAGSQRPVRALRKMKRAFAEFFGLGKRGALFEEAFQTSVVRILQHLMEDRPMIVAAKAPTGGPKTSATRRAEIVVEMGDRVVRGRLLPVRATLTNRGSSMWPAVERAAPGQVRFGVQLLDDKARLVARDHHRVVLPHDVAPGASVSLVFDCPTPDQPGAYMLKFDLTAEGVTWFEILGSPTVSRPLTVI